MISLKAIPKPTELTDKVAQELTARYKQDGSAVWKQKYITEALSKMSNDKCCYCECKITEESKYLEVEHFHPKSLYPDEVVAWENLLPSCKRCNGKKGDHDTKEEPIIHPIRNNPKLHLTWKNYRLYLKTKLGNVTIDVISLNDRKRLVNKRFEIGVRLCDELENLLELTIDYDNRTNFSTKRRNRIVGQLTNLMTEGTRQSEFSATAATVILHENSYSKIKQLFIKNNLWNDEFIELEKEVEFCALDISQ
jgi:5-methylcytosine-specific restriction endonuclease McrA